MTARAMRRVGDMKAENESASFSGESLTIFYTIKIDYLIDNFYLEL